MVGIVVRSSACVAGLALCLLAAPPISGSAAPPSLRPGGTPSEYGMQVLAGSFHDHSTDSDADTASADIAAWEFAKHQELGLDFGILTDHSDGYPVALNAPTSLQPWVRQGQLVKTYSKDGFSWLRGFEVTNDQENHLNVIGSQNWTARTQVGEEVLNMLPFYAWISTQPIADPTGEGLGYGGADGTGQFNHPSSKGALNWDDYAFNQAASSVMATIEIFGDQDRRSPGHSDAGWYWFALSRGWTVSPVMDWDFHHWSGDGVITRPTPGSFCGVHAYLPCERSLAIAPKSTPADIYAALRARRTSASERPDLWATLRGPLGEWQGSTVGGKAGDTLTLTVDAGSSSAPLSSIDIVSDNGVSSYPYYYGDNQPCNPTTFVNPADAVSACSGTGQLFLSYIEQHRRFVASGGHSTRKGLIDSPPPKTTIATVRLTDAEAHRATRVINVTIPSGASERPDGKHFFYAVAHTTEARSWTGPILTDASKPAEVVSGAQTATPTAAAPSLPATTRGVLSLLAVAALIMVAGGSVIALRRRIRFT